MAKILLIVYCMLAYAVASLSASCPSDVSQRIQQCVMSSGALQAAANSLNDQSSMSEFCKVGVQEAMHCVQKYYDMCASNRMQKEILDILIDVQNMKKSLGYFCKNLNVLMEKPDCLTHLDNVGVCVSDITNSFKYGASEMSSLKQILDLTCTFFIDLKDCFVKPFPQSCSDVASLYTNLLEANKFPYCSFSEARKYEAVQKIENARYYTGSSPGLHSCSVLVSFALVAIAIWKTVGL